MLMPGRSIWRISCATAHYVIEAGDTIFAPRMTTLLLRAVILARRHRSLAESTRHKYRRRLEPDLDTVVRSVIGTAARQGINAYQAIHDTLQGHSVLAPD